VASQHKVDTGMAVRAVRSVAAMSREELRNSAVTPTVHPRSLRGGFSPVGHTGSKEVPESSLVPRARKKPCWLRTFKPLGQPQLEAQLRHGVTDLCFLKSP